MSVFYVVDLEVLGCLVGQFGELEAAKQSALKTAEEGTNHAAYDAEHPEPALDWSEVRPGLLSLGAENEAFVLVSEGLEPLRKHYEEIGDDLPDWVDEIAG